MTTLMKLAAGVRALAPTTQGWPTHVGRAVTKDGSPLSLPWAVMNFTAPNGAHVSDSLTITAGNAQLLITLAAASEDGCLVMLDAYTAAFDGVRPVVEGWNVGRFVRVGDSPAVAEDPTVPATGAPIYFTKLLYRFTVSRLDYQEATDG